MEKKNNTENLEINAIHNLPLKKMGDLIKEARINKNQSINELAAALKISEQQLKAIEEGKEDLLPEKVFVRAMVRKISEKLKLDTKYLMTEFNNKTEDMKIDEIVESVKRNPKKKDSTQFLFIIKIVISGLIGLLASSYVFNLFSDTKYESNTPDLIERI